MKDYMMVFMCTTYEELGLSQEELQNRMGKWFAWGNKMEEQGILKGGNALKPDATRIIGNERTVSDGPFAESKEMVGGYYLINVENIEKAKEVAQDFPDYDLGGTVEIREVIVFEQ